MLVGEPCNQAVDRLVAEFDRLRSGDGPIAVCITGETGHGKTRVVQEFYVRLAAERQEGGRYWPASMHGQRQVDVLEGRKRVRPDVSVIPGGIGIPWFWWGISCQRSSSGEEIGAIQNARSQVEVHLQPIVDRIAAREADRDATLEILKSGLTVMGMANPLALATTLVASTKEATGLFRRLRKRRKQTVEQRSDRVVDTVGADSFSAGETLAAALVGVASADLPVVIVVDDAHWADHGTVNMLRRIMQSKGAAVLIVSTTWPHELTRQADEGPRKFGAWWSDASQMTPDRTVLLELPRMSTTDLGRMLLTEAPLTRPEIVEATANLADGNPLVLRLLLGLDVVRRDIVDGALDKDLAELAQLPNDVQAIFQDLWRGLPEDVRTALALLASQGEEFIPGFLDRVGNDLRMISVVEGFRKAQEQFGWVVSSDGRGEFSERARFEVAFENQASVFETEQLERIQHVLVDYVGELKREGWDKLSEETRLLALRQHVALADSGAATSPEDLADSALQLSALNATLDRKGQAIENAKLAVEAADKTTDAKLKRSAREQLVEVLANDGRAAEALSVMSGLTAQEAGDSDQAAIDAGVAAELVDAAEKETAKVAAAADGPLVPYRAWEPREIADPTSLTPSEAGDLIAEVVEVEGPVVFGRVCSALMAASPVSRMGRQVRGALESGLTSALRRDLVDATRASDSMDRVLTAPGQETTPRESGPRDLAEIPSDELRQLAASVLAVDPDLDLDGLKRELLTRYGWSRMSERASSLLGSALKGLPYRDTEAEDAALDRVRALADRYGCADAFAAMISLSEDTPLGMKRWPNSVTLTPPGKPHTTVCYVAPLPGGKLNVQIQKQRLVELLGMEEATAEQLATSDEGRELDLDQVLEVSGLLRRHMNGSTGS